MNANRLTLARPRRAALLWVVVTLSAPVRVSAQHVTPPAGAHITAHSDAHAGKLLAARAALVTPSERPPVAIPAGRPTDAPPTARRCGARCGAVIGAVSGAALGAVWLREKGDYRSCANDVGPGFCRVGQGIVVLGAGAVGAAVGAWIAHRVTRAS